MRTTVAPKGANLTREPATSQTPVENIPSMIAYDVHFLQEHIKELVNEMNEYGVVLKRSEYRFQEMMDQIKNLTTNLAQLIELAKKSTKPL